ncbi:MAG: hypothetical protein HY688_03120 [Chloroflexi bacterium]|nr:hypothetical protein [Chloroflexota bacterium]
MGEENRGWYVAMTSLNFERSGIEIPTKLLRALETFLDYCKRRRAEGQPLLADARVRHLLADLRVQIGVNQMISYRVAWMQSRGEVPVKEASMSKMWGDELTPRFYRTMARILRDYGVLGPGDKRAPLGGYPGVNGWLSGMNSVGGGTAEIQRNIVAQRGLGLPR